MHKIDHDKPNQVFREIKPLQPTFNFGFREKSGVNKLVDHLGSTLCDTQKRRRTAGN